MAEQQRDWAAEFAARQAACKHDGDLFVVRQEFYSYSVRREDDGRLVLDWMSGDFVEGGEFERDQDSKVTLQCNRCQAVVTDVSWDQVETDET